MTNTMKGGHQKTTAAPDEKPDDITTALNSPAPVVPPRPPNDIRIEHVPDEIDEAAMEQAFKAYQSFGKEVGRDASKRWDGMPDKYRPPHYVYYRCGLKGDPRTEFVRGELKSAGFQDAPKGTVCGFALSDRGNGVYVCVRSDIYRQFHHIENELIREKTDRALKKKKLEATKELSDLGIEIEGVKEETSTMSAEEFMGGRDGVVQKASFK